MEPRTALYWPRTGVSEALIAIAGTGAVTAMNVAAVRLVGTPAPHQLGLGLCQFLPERYHRVVHAWSMREAGDARAAHPDRYTLRMSALSCDGTEVPVVVTRRMLGDDMGAPYLVTMRTVVPLDGLRDLLLPSRS